MFFSCMKPSVADGSKSSESETAFRGFASLSLPAFSQDEEGLRYRSEAAVQAFGSFVKSTVNDGVRVNPLHLRDGSFEFNWLVRIKLRGERMMGSYRHCG